MTVEGTQDYEDSIAEAGESDRPMLLRLLGWAKSLEAAGLARCYTTVGQRRWALVPRVAGDSVGLVTIWNDNGPYLSVFRSVFERRGALAPLRRVEALVAPTTVGQGTTLKRISEDLLDALTQAYREATSS